MTWLLVLHLATGAACAAAGDRLGRRAFVVAAGPPAALLVWLAVQLPAVLDGDVVEQHADWVPRLGLGVDLRLDAFAGLVLLLVTGIGVAVMAYGSRYHRDGAVAPAREAGLLCAFAGAMAGLVLADDLLVLVTCWELTSVTSYLLIGNRHTRARARSAALHALLVTGAGGMCLLAGAVLLGREAGTFRISELLADPPAGGGVGIGLALVLLGAFTKSAQYPFHGWLPGAMVAPTPISAYLHSATMVKAGVYLIARFAPAFAATGSWRVVVVGVGLVTMVGGGLRALRQHDLKLLLAFGTVSQLGFLTVLVGAGVPEAATAGCLLLLAHGAFKATLFFSVGVLDKVVGTRDLRELPVLRAGWGWFSTSVGIAAASMAGIPLAAGFVAKEAAYAAFEDGPVSASAVVLGALVAASALTAAYSWRLAWGVLGAPARRGAAPAGAAPDRAFLLPGAALSAATLGVGVAPGLVDGLVGAAARSLDPSAPAPHLALWHGWNLPLALSALTFLGGAAVVAAVARAEPRLGDRHLGPTSAEVYRSALRGLNAFADRVTGVTQSGSLPVYTGVVLLTAALLPTAALLLGEGGLRWPEAVDTPAHVVVAVVLVGSALAAATVRRRLSAVLFLGVTGYAMAGLFIVQGAPDLALTQVTVETLSTVLFVLVLRRLGVRFERRSSRSTRALRIAVAASVATGVFVFALHVGELRDDAPVSDEITARALPEGEGRNVVNVILVDVRGLDTLGEVTVLATAAIGMVALARAGRRPSPQRRAPATRAAEAGGGGG